MAHQTSVIERLDRVHDGEVSKYINEATRDGRSHREIAVGLAQIFGIHVARTTVLRYLARQAAA